MHAAFPGELELETDYLRGCYCCCCEKTTRYTTRSLTDPPPRRVCAPVRPRRRPALAAQAASASVSVPAPASDSAAEEGGAARRVRLRGPAGRDDEPGARGAVGSTRASCARGPYLVSARTPSHREKNNEVTHARSMHSATMATVPPKSPSSSRKNSSSSSSFAPCPRAYPRPSCSSRHSSGSSPASSARCAARTSRRCCGGCGACSSPPTLVLAAATPPSCAARRAAPSPAAGAATRGGAGIASGSGPGSIPQLRWMSLHARPKLHMPCSAYPAATPSVSGSLPNRLSALSSSPGWKSAWYSARVYRPMRERVAGRAASADVSYAAS